MDVRGVSGTDSNPCWTMAVSGQCWGFCRQNHSLVLPGPPGALPGAGGFEADDNFRVVLQLIKAAVRQHIPGGHARDLRSSAVRHTRFNRAHMRGVVLQNINKRSLPVMLDCRAGN